MFSVERGLASLRFIVAGLQQVVETAARSFQSLMDTNDVNRLAKHFLSPSAKKQTFQYLKQVSSSVSF